MALKSGRVGVKNDQIDLYGRIRGLNGQTLQETLNALNDRLTALEEEESEESEETLEPLT